MGEEGCAQLDEAYSTAISKTPILLSILLDCSTLHAAIGREAADVDPSNASVCDFALEHCRNALATSLNDLGFKDWPAWIAQHIGGGTPKGDSTKASKKSKKKSATKKKKVKKKKPAKKKKNQKNKKPAKKNKKKNKKTGKRASSEFDEL